MIHPFLTSFPVVLCLVIGILELMALRREAILRPSINILLGLLLLTMCLAFFSGYYAATGASISFTVPVEAIEFHQLWGKLALFLSIPAVILGWFQSAALQHQIIFKACYRFFLLATIIVTIYTGYLGGQLVYARGAGVYAPFPVSQK